MKRGGKFGAAAGDSTGLSGAGIGDAAVRKATGKGWGDWYSLLDAAGAREMSHQQIRTVVAGHESREWWQQMIATAYEQARGLRERDLREDGFTAHTSKTLLAGVTRVYAAWAEEDQRAGWLDASGWHIRKATPCKSLRITWKDGRSHVEVHLWPRGVGKTLIQVEHGRLASLEDAHRMKAFWGVALERLREKLEAQGAPHALTV